jgi:WhiB family transcriptional regulator, redox-sensing transcriptional regulator
MAARRRHALFTARSPRPLLEDWTWQERGSCRNMPTELFFPEDGSRHHRSANEQRAKRICRDCPVLAECREHAVAIQEPFGVWGAMTALERARSIAAVGDETRV